jgi:hypothetical protein
MSPRPINPDNLFPPYANDAHAVEEAELLLIERSGTPNTGNAATAAKRVVL